MSRGGGGGSVAVAAQVEKAAVLQFRLVRPCRGNVPTLRSNHNRTLFVLPGKMLQNLQKHESFASHDNNRHRTFVNGELITPLELSYNLEHGYISATGGFSNDHTGKLQFRNFNVWAMN